MTTTPVVFRNNKTQRRYIFVSFVTDATSGNEGQRMVLYRDEEKPELFVREVREFEKKFTPEGVA